MDIIIFIFFHISFVQTITCLKHSGEHQDIKLEKGYRPFAFLHYDPNGKHAYMVAGSTSLFTVLIKLNVKTGKTTVVRTSHPSTDDIDQGYLSTNPKKVSWDTTLGAKAHGYYYPPQVG